MVSRRLLLVNIPSVDRDLWWLTFAIMICLALKRAFFFKIYSGGRGRHEVRICRGLVQGAVVDTVCVERAFRVWEWQVLEFWTIQVVQIKNMHPGKFCQKFGPVQAFHIDGLMGCEEGHQNTAEGCIRQIATRPRHAMDIADDPTEGLLFASWKYIPAVGCLKWPSGVVAVL